MRSLALALVLLTGCGGSTAGPFVTDIARAPDGTLLVHRCTVELSQWTGKISNVRCNRSPIR